MTLDPPHLPFIHGPECLEASVVHKGTKLLKGNVAWVSRVKAHLTAKSAVKLNPSPEICALQNVGLQYFCLIASIKSSGRTRTAVVCVKKLLLVVLGSYLLTTVGHFHLLNTIVTMIP